MTRSGPNLFLDPRSPTSSLIGLQTLGHGFFLVFVQVLALVLVLFVLLPGFAGSGWYTAPGDGGLPLAEAHSKAMYEWSGYWTSVAFPWLLLTTLAAALAVSLGGKFRAPVWKNSRLMVTIAVVVVPFAALWLNTG